MAGEAEGEVRLRPPAPPSRRLKLSAKTRQVISPPKRDARGQFLSRDRKRRILAETEAIEQRIIDA